MFLGMHHVHCLAAHCSLSTATQDGRSVSVGILLILAVQPPAQAGIFTLSVRIGAPQVFWTCIVLLEAAYAGAVAFGLTSPVQPSPICTCLPLHLA